MSNCCVTLSSGICRGCRDNAGGLKAVYAINACQLTGVTTDDNDNPTEVTDLKLVAAAQLFALQTNLNSSNAVETINSSRENGTLFLNQVLSLVFGKNSKALRATMMELIKGEIVFITKDQNDQLWLYGDVNDGMICNGGTGQTGTALGDLNGWSPTFERNSRIAALPISSSATITIDNGGTPSSKDIKLVLEQADEEACNA